jgi:iron complex outermembrane receptor protein
MINKSIGTRIPVKVLSSSILFIVAGWAGVPAALAQTGDSAAEPVMEEIIVSARRREESLQDVPGTVTALSEETLRNAGVERASDFVALTPGVSMVDAAEVGDTQVNIRGINGARDAENSFAFLIDGVLYTNPAAFNREYTDLRQIEVFKGPQGAIYGRNAAAGAIIVTTTRPTNDFETNGTISIAQDSTYLGKGGISGALIEDELFFRLSADWRSSDGYYNNIYLGRDDVVDAYEGFNVNARLIWEAGDNTTWDTKLRVGTVDASSITFNSTFALPVFAAL